MANFCTKCGKKLEQGQKCTCEKIKTESKIVNENNKDLITIIKEFINKPIDTIKTNENNKENNYVIILLSSFSLGLFSSFFYRHTLISSTIISFLSILLFTFIITLIANLFYGETREYNKVLQVVALSSIALLGGTLISFILCFLSGISGIIIELMTLILFILYIYHGLSLKLKIDKNKIGYVLVTSILVTIFIIMVILFRI